MNHVISKLFMIKGYVVISVVLLAGLLFNPQIVLAELTPTEILARSDSARGNLAGAEWNINIDSVNNGRKRVRRLKLKASNHNSLAEFIAPARVKGRKLLMIERNMWFVKPGLRKPVPISPRQKLLGGASYGDIASTNYSGDYKVTSMDQDMLNGEPCYRFDLAAINQKVTYDRIKYWIWKERLVGVKSEFFTVSGKMFEAATLEYDNQVEFDGKSQAFVSKMIITDAVAEKDVTTLSYSKVKLNKIPNAAFNLNLLAR